MQQRVSILIRMRNFRDKAWEVQDRLEARVYKKKKKGPGKKGVKIETAYLIRNFFLIFGMMAFMPALVVMFGLGIGYMMNAELLFYTGAVGFITIVFFFAIDDAIQKRLNGGEEGKKENNEAQN